MGGDRRLAPADSGIVGRDEDLATLDRVLTDSCAGRLGLVLVEGEGGIGKTRLVRALAAGAATRGVRVMAGACLALGTTIPYLPFAEMLRDLVRDLSDQERSALLGPGGEILAPLLHPEASPRTRQGSSQSSGDGSGEMARLAMFESLLRMTERLATRQPLLVILEDIQWADRATFDLVTFLTRNLRAARIMLVMTARTGGPAPDALAPFAAGLERHQRVEHMASSAPSASRTPGASLPGSWVRKPTWTSSDRSTAAVAATRSSRGSCLPGRGPAHPGTPRRHRACGTWSPTASASCPPRPMACCASHLPPVASWTTTSWSRHAACRPRPSRPGAAGCVAGSPGPGPLRRPGRLRLPT